MGGGNILSPEIKSEFLTVSEVARMMRVSNMTVYRMIRSGELSAFRIGSRYRLKESDVRRYLDENYVKAV